MSASSKTSAFLWKGVLDPRKHVWRDLKFQKICMFEAKIRHWHMTRCFFGKVCPLGCLEKVCIFPHSSVSAKNRGERGGGRGEERYHSITITLCWYFLFFSFSCSTKIDSLDLFWLHVEFRCEPHTSKNYVSPRDQKLPYVQSSLRTCDGGA